PRAQTILARAFTYDDPSLTPGTFFNVVRTGSGRRTVRAISYFNVRQNIGTLEGYSAVVIPTNVAPRFFVNASNEYVGNPAYRGEAYVLDGSADAGSVGMPMFEPNRIELPVRLNHPATIVINQNYDRDWQPDHGTVLNMNGLLAVRSDESGAYTVHLAYRPRAFYAGIACSLTTLIALAAFGLRRTRRAPLKEEMHMRTRIGSVFFTVAMIAAAAALVTAQGGGAQGRAGGGGGRGPAVPPMLMTTTAFEDGGILPAKYAGAMGVSPALNWTQVPPGTQSLVLLLHDPEPALNKGLMDVTHWLVWNIPATTTGLPEGVQAAPEAPDGMRQVSLRSNGYMGPGAPAGPYHHYTFELFAVDTKIDVPQGEPAQAAETRTAVMNAIDGHVLSR